MIVDIETSARSALGAISILARELDEPSVPPDKARRMTALLAMALEARRGAACRRRARRIAALELAEFAGRRRGHRDRRQRSLGGRLGVAPRGHAR